MPTLPNNFKPGDRLEAATVNEMVRRINRLENTKYNVNDFTVTNTAEGRTIGLVPSRDPKKKVQATEARFGYLMATTTTPLVIVQFLKHEIQQVGGSQQGSWTSDGEPRAAWLFPNAQPTDVVQLVRSAFTNTTPIVRLDKINDVWYVTWVPRWSVIQIPQNVPIVRCA